jgi:hypothetical protein
VPVTGTHSFEKFKENDKNFVIVATFFLKKKSFAG